MSYPRKRVSSRGDDTCGRCKGAAFERANVWEHKWKLAPIEQFNPEWGDLYDRRTPERRVSGPSLDARLRGHDSSSQLLPISIPTPSTNPPPSITLAMAESGGVSMNRHWIQAMVASSNTTTMHAMNVAVQKFGIR